MKNYKTFVDRVTECDIPPLDKVLTAVIIKKYA